jgi:hypothetical protein
MLLNRSAGTVRRRDELREGSRKSFLPTPIIALGPKGAALTITVLSTCSIGEPSNFMKIDDQPPLTPK